ncbi:MipA/OmpV family protein [Teredinibacter sp. KSP-S5-2]|uniref:MipA/OmpV family protein n=1 Tax=Teredinibacter sp. KSP-S5-2 TaxID=3034506 RepID=UPI0029349808|nr:MipA/OmpV family protein [Teredinibacter sp. KSP-S5-2]WNO08750.1 MipA/OmpV family protein [Teredinibacter sp. KSP-S5-2]
MTPDVKKIGIWIALVLMVVSIRSYASDSCQPDKEKCVEVGSWEFALAIGVGERTNPLVGGDDIPIYLLPEVSYYGKRIFLDNLVLGYTLLDSPHHMLNGVATIGYEQIYFDRWNIGNFAIEGGSSSPSGFGGGLSGGSSGDGLEPDSGSGSTGQIPEPDGGEWVDGGYVDGGSVDYDQLNDRRTAGLAGLEYSYYYRNFHLQTQALQDFTSVHDGNEFRLAATYSLPYRRHEFNFSGGFSWQSSELLDYYYGIEPGELISSNIVYTAEDGVTPFVKFNGKISLSPHWSLQATLHHKWLSREIYHSPIVEEKQVTTYFFGLVYHF